eukprot:6916388-Heterocapsa_arctica.AAC.1
MSLCPWLVQPARSKRDRVLGCGRRPACNPRAWSSSRLVHDEGELVELMQCHPSQGVRVVQ